MKTEVHLCDFCAHEGLRKAVATCILCGKDFCSEAHAGHPIAVRVHGNKIIMHGEPLCKDCDMFASRACVDFPADAEVDAAGKLLQDKYIEHLRAKWAARALDPTALDPTRPSSPSLVDVTAEDMLQQFREYQEQQAAAAKAQAQRAAGWPKPPSVNYK